jgi:hypothetical protein
MKKACVLVSVALSIFALVGCQKQTFGVDEDIWSGLSETERAKVIEDYNKKEELKIAGEQKIREKELENERAAKELEARTAPIHAAADVISSLRGNSKHESRKDSKKESSKTLEIRSIKSTFSSQVITIDDSSFEVSPFSTASKAWMKGQKVKLSSDSKNSLYPVVIKNLDNGEEVFAR